MSDDDRINITVRSWANVIRPVAYAVFPAAVWLRSERKLRRAARMARKKRRGW